MMKERHKIANKIKEKVLIEAISAISIKNVVERYPNGAKDGDVYAGPGEYEDRSYNIQLYVKTTSLKTIDISALEKTIKKYSNNKINISYVVPTNKVIEDVKNIGYSVYVKNTDSINIYIRVD